MFSLERWQPEAEDPIQHLNVGTGVDLSIKELAELVAATVGYEGDIHWDTSKPNGTPKKQLEVGRLAELGWKARIPLAEGLAATYALYAQ